MIRMKKLRLLTVLVALAMLLTVLAGCQEATTTTTTGAGETSSTTVTGSTDVVLPLTDEEVTFTGFFPIVRAEADMSQNEVWQKMYELTNVTIDWESVTIESAQERFTLILASQQLPDLMMQNAQVSYPGGYETAVDDEVFLDLKPLLPEYAPVYWDLLSGNASALRDALTDKGYIPALYQVMVKDTNLNTGLWTNVTRADWLADLDLETPETIDEWTTTLTAFKEEKGATFPLLWQLGNNPIWAQAWGVRLMPFSPNTNGNYQQFYPDDNNVIHYGGIEQGFEDYLVQFSEWYEAGLFDRDFATRAIFDLPTAATLFGTNEAGVTGGYLAWTGMYMANATDDDFEIAVCPTPVLNKGDKGSQVSTRAEYLYDPMAITTGCENPELLLQFFNWLSTEDGQNLSNYGIEGEHFTMEDGVPTLTDKVLMDDMGAYDALEVMTSSYRPIKLTATENLMSQVYSEQTLTAAQIPSDSTNVVYMYYALNEDEALELAEIFGDINTYVAENWAQAIMNPDLAANWMEVQAETIKGMGIERAIEICQGSWDRYMAKQ